MFVFPRFNQQGMEKLKAQPNSSNRFGNDFVEMLKICKETKFKFPRVNYFN